MLHRRQRPDDTASKLSVYVSHRADLVDYATPILGCRSLAEDVVQDAYIRFSKAIDGEGEPRPAISHPVGYLYRIVRNLALNRVRRRATQRETDDFGGLDAIAANVPSPEETSLYRGELRAVAAALSVLPYRTRRAFELYRLGGYTLQQVADALDISVGQAHRLIQDAMIHCAERLGYGKR